MAFRKEIGATRSFSWDELAVGRAQLIRQAVDAVPLRGDRSGRGQSDPPGRLLVQGGASWSGVFPISSGNGEAYTNEFGSFSNAHTPTGNFKIQRHIRGERISFLGVLWNPWYFTGGYALHGSPSVPAFPASHGLYPSHDVGQLLAGEPARDRDPGPCLVRAARRRPGLRTGRDAAVGGPAPCPGGNCDTVAFYDSRLQVLPVGQDRPVARHIGLLLREPERRCLLR